MKEIIGAPIFWVFTTILAYEIGLIIYKKTNIAIFNPLLISIGIVILALVNLNVSLDTYMGGGSLISFFLIPATVILAVPLYRQREIFKANAIPILIGITVGSITSIVSVTLLSKAFGLTDELTRSLIPKSITTPIGMEVSKQLGGIQSITVTSIVITGILGAIIGPYVCKLFRIKDSVAVGVSMGTASHAIGTSKALEIGETEGAMSGLSIGIAGLITVLIVPLLVRILL